MHAKPGLRMEFSACVISGSGSRYWGKQSVLKLRKIYQSLRRSRHPARILLSLTKRRNLHIEIDIKCFTGRDRCVRRKNRELVLMKFQEGMRFFCH